MKDKYIVTGKHNDHSFEIGEEVLLIVKSSNRDEGGNQAGLFMSEKSEKIQVVEMRDVKPSKGTGAAKKATRAKKRSLDSVEVGDILECPKGCLHKVMLELPDGKFVISEPDDYSQTSGISSLEELRDMELKKHIEPASMGDGRSGISKVLQEILDEAKGKRKKVQKKEDDTLDNREKMVKATREVIDLLEEEEKRSGPASSDPERHVQEFADYLVDKFTVDGDSIVETMIILGIRTHLMKFKHDKYGK